MISTRRGNDFPNGWGGTSPFLGERFPCQMKRRPSSAENRDGQLRHEIPLTRIPRGKRRKKVGRGRRLNSAITTSEGREKEGERRNDAVSLTLPSVREENREEELSSEEEGRVSLLSGWTGLFSSKWKKRKLISLGEGGREGGEISLPCHPIVLAQKASVYRDTSYR